MARHYIRAFLHAPYLAPDTPYGRDAESLVDLHVLAALPIAENAGFPLEPVLTPAYLDMLNAHAAVLHLLPPKSSQPRRGRAVVGPAPDSPELARARQQRTRAASSVLAVWRRFESGLDDIPGLTGKSAVLAIFRLNDASYTRAAWFVEEPPTE